MPSNTITTKILGDSILSNIYMVGYAYQSGLIPINADSIEQAIKLNGASEEENLNAFRLGRHSLKLKKEVLNTISEKKKVLTNFEEKYDDRYNYLIKYQNEKYAKEYRYLVDFAKISEEKIGNGNKFSTAVLNNYFKLMSYKDEYEISRLYSDIEFIDKVKNKFDGNYKINFYLSPPIFYKKDKVTGNPLKIKFGQWFINIFKIISKLKFLRGTLFDPFGYLQERKNERRLVKDYKNTVLEIGKKLTLNNYDNAVDIASLPDQIRGFGHVKEKNLRVAEECKNNLMNAFNESK
tara:strand:- start:253 stop:1131 length:879 start_codon:yes stop_codon:yes gene_type:complete